MFFEAITNQSFPLSMMIISCFSFLLTYFMIDYLIVFFKEKEKFQSIRIFASEEQKAKFKTPTMGGIAILTSSLFSLMLFYSISPIVVSLIILFISFGLIGLFDDLMKVYFNNTNGISAKVRIIVEFLFAGFVILYLRYSGLMTNTTINIPILNLYIDLGVFYYSFALILIVGTSNAFNITDGLDGLVSLPAALIFYIFSFCAFNAFNIQLSYFSISMLSSILAYFCFNRRPAKIFMGDVGSLPIGAVLAIMALILKVETFFIFAGSLFFIEATSSMFQKSCEILKKQSFLKMAPLHHHFEQIGWSEKKITSIFWIFSIITIVLGIIFGFDI